jgi:hypothetical protein
LGRIVAGDKTQTFFISFAQWFTRALVHGAFRRRFQILVLHCPDLLRWNDNDRGTMMFPPQQAHIAG